MTNIDKLAYKGRPTESAESRSITTRARATVRALVDELVASLGRTEAGGLGGSPGRTETSTSDKSQHQSCDQSLQQVDSNGTAQVLTAPEAEDADQDAASIIDDDSFPNPDRQRIELACVNAVGGVHVLFDPRDAHLNDGEIDLDNDAWIAFDPDHATDISGRGGI